MKKEFKNKKKYPIMFYISFFIMFMLVSLTIN